MECKWDSCKNEARVRSPFCSGTCKKRAQRHAEQTSGTFVPVEVGHALSGTQVGQLRDKVLEHQDSAQIRHERDFISDAGITGGMSRETLIKIDTACGDNISGQPDVPSEQTAKTPPDEARSSLSDASLSHYKVYPEKYIPRAEPDKLNWGPWMDMSKLKQAGFKANRVSIPGDWDYGAVA